MVRINKSKPGHAARKRKRLAEEAAQNGASKQTKTSEVSEDIKNLLTGAVDAAAKREAKAESKGVGKAEVENGVGKTSTNGGAVAEAKIDGAEKGGERIVGAVDEMAEKREERGGGGGDEKTLEKSATPATAATSAGAGAVSWGMPLCEGHAKKIKVTVILDRANLEVTKASSHKNAGLTLLNCDEHVATLRRTNRDANDARPDITHQCLLALQDSPLNKAGKLKVYIKSARNVLIDVHPQTRVPRTYKRFAGLFTELLEKLKVRGTSGSTPLLKVIRNPVTSHLPVGARKIVCTYNTDHVVDMREHAHSMAQLAFPTQTKTQTLKDDEPTTMQNEILQQQQYEKMKHDSEWVEEHAQDVNVVYVIGAMAHGKITEDWADDYICISEYPLSASTVCSRLLYSYESLLGIM